MRFLYKCRITCFGDSYTLNCSPLNSKGQKNKSVVFRGSEAGFKKFLQKVQAKDTQTAPASVRNTTYQSMINTAKDGSDPYVYIWSNLLPQEGVIRESKEASFLEGTMPAREFIEYSKNLFMKESVNSFITNIITSYRDKMQAGTLYSEISPCSRFQNFEEIINKFLNYLWDFYFKDLKKESSVIVYISSIYDSFTAPIEFEDGKPSKFIIYVNTNEDNMSYILENIAHEFIHVHQYYGGMKKEGNSIYYQGEVYPYFSPSDNIEMYLSMPHEKDAYFNEEDIVNTYKEDFADHIFEEVEPPKDFYIL